MGPKRGIALVEPMPGWWNSGWADVYRDFFITGTCGHHVIRRSRSTPKFFRCEICYGMSN